MIPSYEAVLFDLGNVVLRIHLENCFQIWAKSSGLSPHEISKRFVQDAGYAAHEVARLSGEQYHMHVCQLVEMKISYAQFVEGWNAIFGDTIEETQSLIEDLGGRYKLYILSNSNVLHRNVWSQRYEETLKLFDRVFCSSQIGFRKPDHQAFAKVCSETNIPKGKFVFVDDLKENILGAETFGIKSFLFSDPKESVRQVRNHLLA